MIRSIGINADSERIDGDFAAFRHWLRKFHEIGFDTVELSVAGLNCIRAGQFIPHEAARVLEALAPYNFRITAHAPNDLNLIRSPMHGDVMAAVLEAARVFGAERVVYHSAQIALRDAYRSLAPLPSDDALAEMWERETEALIACGRRAADLGLTLSVENRDPHLWEISALGMHGLPPSELARYHQGLRLDLLARQMERINLPNVGLCLDVGHAFLAAPYWPQPDYLSAVQACAPWVNHLHFHDNYGRIDDLTESLSERLAFGEADSHVPPGWGRIPLKAVLNALCASGYDGHLVLEIRPRYSGYLDEALSATRALLRESSFTGD
jgi:sugar phosphate isomerase/epimerase